MNINKKNIWFVIAGIAAMIVAAIVREEMKSGMARILVMGIGGAVLGLALAAAKKFDK